MPSVGPLASGFKQVPSAGYVTVISTLNYGQVAGGNVYAKPVTAGSGGSATIASPALLKDASLPSLGPISTLLRAGNVLKDMGSVAVSSSRVFRKFKAVGLASSGAGGDLTTDDKNFGTFYLEVASDGGDVPDANKSILARSA